MERTSQDTEHHQDAASGYAEKERGLHQELGPEPRSPFERIHQIGCLQVPGVEIAKGKADAGKRNQHDNDEIDENRDTPVLAADQLLFLSSCLLLSFPGCFTWAGG